MNITFVDRNLEFIHAIEDIFPKKTVSTFCGDIFKIEAQALVSPANSFGFMDGGIDQVYTDRFGGIVQESLQNNIKEMNFGEILVGQATHVCVDDPVYEYIIVAPTMRVPKRLPDSINIRLAFRAALDEANWLEVQSIVFPGMGTGVGGVNPKTAAYEMLRGYMDFYAPKPFPVSIQAAMRDEDIYKIGTFGGKTYEKRM